GAGRGDRPADVRGRPVAGDVLGDDGVVEGEGAAGVADPAGVGGGGRGVHVAGDGAVVDGQGAVVADAAADAQHAGVVGVGSGGDRRRCVVPAGAAVGRGEVPGEDAGGQVQGGPAAVLDAAAEGARGRDGVVGDGAGVDVQRAEVVDAAAGRARRVAR